MSILTDFSKAITGLGRRGQHNWIKILCLGVGLATGFVLIAKVFFEQTFDTFLPDAERIYMVNEKIERGNSITEHVGTSGAIAHGIKRYAPQVENATRYMLFQFNGHYRAPHNKELVACSFFADTSFFDVLQRKIYSGNPHKILLRPSYCMIKKSLADALGGDVIGKKLILQEAGNMPLYIGGVFEDFPLNSYLTDLDILVSLPTLKLIFNDGSQRWYGNDCYYSFIKLKPGTSVNDLEEPVHKMRQENLPVKELKAAGTDVNYSYMNITKLHKSVKFVQQMSWILSLLAFVLIFSAVMNYLLILVGGISRRAKEMAVLQCYGAESKDIYRQVFIESCVHLFLSLVVASLLIYTCRGMILELVCSPVSALFFNKGSWILVVVCLLVLIVTGIVPGRLYASIPVVAAFRGYTRSYNRWKLVLLSVQFTVTGFLFCLLLVIGLQYHLIVNDSPGFDYRQLVSVDLSGLRDKREKTIEELKKLPGVKGVTTAYSLLIYGASGDNISLPGTPRQLMNIADLYDVGDDYYKVMGIKILQGKGFTEHMDSSREVMVSQLFVKKMEELANWKESVVGRKILITGHGNEDKPFTIVGVYRDVRIGALDDIDERASIMTYDKHPSQNVILRFEKVTPEEIMAVNRRLKELYPTMSLVARSYSSMTTGLYEDSYRFRNMVMVGGIVTLVVTLIGLIGYTNDEVSRRHKEIAIRKVNGAGMKDILGLFMRGILCVAVPSLVVGGAGAYFVSVRWLEQFSERIPISLWMFVAVIIGVLLVILAVVNINCYKVANSNPVDYLRGNE